MLEETQIVTETIDQTKFFITFISVSMGGTFIFANIAVAFREPIFGLIGLVLFIIIPLTLLKRIILFFTKRIKIVFFENYFSVLRMDSNPGLMVDENKFFYQDILSCTINSAQVKTSSIGLVLANVGKKKYVFNNLKGRDTGNVGEMIYNNIKMRKPDVILKPAFFASRKGGIYVISMAIILTILLLLHIFYSPKTSPFTFLISISVFINILSQRTKDIERFKRLSIGQS